MLLFFSGSDVHLSYPVIVLGVEFFFAVSAGVDAGRARPTGWPRAVPPRANRRLHARMAMAPSSSSSQPFPLNSAIPPHPVDGVGLGRDPQVQHDLHFSSAWVMRLLWRGTNPGTLFSTGAVLLHGCRNLVDNYGGSVAARLLFVFCWSLSGRLVSILVGRDSFEARGWDHYSVFGHDHLLKLRQRFASKKPQESVCVCARMCRNVCVRCIDEQLLSCLALGTASAGDKARADREPGSETLVGAGHLGTGAVVVPQPVGR